MNNHNAAHSDLLTAQQLAYEPHGFVCKNIILEKESTEYSACEFEINNLRVKFRAAKVTPTKVGQFVTLWKRIGDSPIMPFDLADPINLFIVSVRKDEQLGQFVFPKDVLCEKGFVSKNGRGGKRAMRAYPPWDVPDNPQAQKTQTWQLHYFFEILPNVDHAAIPKLFSLGQ